MKFGLCALVIACAGFATRAQPAKELAADSPADAPANAPNSAQTIIERPDAAQRVVSIFDFEEPAIYATPRYWRRLVTRPAEEDAQAGPGYPSWNEPMLEIDPRQAFAGEGSVRLPTRGGSVGMRLDAGVVPVFPGAEYLVSAVVRTEGLRAASPGLIARYLDKNNEVIPSSEVVTLSDPLARRGTVETPENPDWSRLTLAVPGGPPDAAYMQIDLVLLQPDVVRSLAIDHPELPVATDAGRQDLSGRARFDDVTIVQLPRVTLDVGAAGHCFVAPQVPELALTVRDLTGEALLCQITLQDAAGRTVDHVERTIRSGTAKEIWRPTLPAVTHLGWFRATVDLYAVGSRQRVGSTYADFCVLEPARQLGQLGYMELTDRERFALLVESLDAPEGSIHELIDASGAGAVALPAWDRSLRARAVKARIKALESLVAHVTSGRRSAWMSIAQPPDELAAKARETGSLDEALALPESEWAPLLGPIVERFGAGVQRWIVGDPRRQPLWSVPINDRAAEIVARVIPGASILRVEPGESSLPRAGAQSGPVMPPVLSASLADSPDSIGQLAYALRENRAASNTATTPLRSAPPALLLVSPSPEELALRGWRESAAALTRAMLQVWTSWSESARLDAPTLALTAPWRVDGPGLPRAMPTPLLAAWRHVSMQLAGRRVAGRIDLAPGVEGLILRPLDPLRSGALVAWRTTADPDASIIEADLGDGSVEVSDMFGNRAVARRGGAMVQIVPEDRSATPESSGALEKVHRIRVPNEPIFIEGVDVPLARFVSTFRVEPPLLSMFQRDHQVLMVIENPWPVRIDGRLRIVEPGGLSGSGKRDRGWVVSPRILSFALAPGETAKLPVQVAFSPSEEAGPKAVVADVELTAERIYETFRIKSIMELGLDTIDLSLDARLTPDPIDGPDAEVRVQVTNRGKEPLSMELVAWAAGYPRGKASASKVPPTGVVLRRFFFPDGAAKLKGQRVTVGVEDVQSRARITRSVPVE